MFSSVSSSLSKKLTLRFVITLIMSNIVMVLSLFFFLRHELAKKDKNIASIRFHEVHEVIESHGVDMLRDPNEIAEFNRFGDLLIRILDSSGKVVFQKYPQKIDNFNPDDLEKSLLLAAQKDGNHTVYPKEIFEETIEIFSGVLKEYRIIVGINTDSSEDIINLYLKWAIIFTILSSLVSVSVGFNFSNNSLKPVRELISAVKKIRGGDMTTELKSVSSGDELSELTQLFNQMIAQIRKLIRIQQTSLDAIAHDMRTPLTHMVNKLELKLRDSQSSETKDVLGDILEETHSISALVNNLLELTESESSSQVLRLEEVKLFNLVNECLEIYEFVIEEKKVGVQFICDEGLTIFADKNKFKRILANLIDNSLKYSLANPQVIIACKREGNATCISVIDNGSGISMEESKNIWERLYRGDSSRNTTGVGLGLSFVRSIVEAHGWTIQLIPKDGSGSHFKINIPH